MGGVFAIVTSYDKHGFQIVDVSSPANPTAVSTATDGQGGFTVLRTPRGMGTYKLAGQTHAIVSSRYDTGVQMVSLADPATPTPAGTAVDGVDGIQELNQPWGVDTFVQNGQQYAVVAGYQDGGIEIIR